MRTWYDLTESFPFKFDVEKMRQEYEFIKNEKFLEHYDPTLSRDWTTLPLVSKAGEAINAESQRVASYEDMKRTDICERLPYFTEILDNFKCPHGRIRISRLGPGAEIRVHRDIKEEVANVAFGRVRLHVPIYTNDKLVFSVGGERIRMVPGRLYYADFSKKHYVRNEGSTERVHLMLDLLVNDWLTQFFPRFSPLERAEHAAWRTILPVHWKLLSLGYRSRHLFWRYYEGSRLQALRHRYLAPK